MTRGFFHVNVHFVNTRGEKLCIRSFLLLDETSLSAGLTKQALRDKPVVVNSRLNALIPKEFMTVSRVFGESRPDNSRLRAFSMNSEVLYGFDEVIESR